MFIEIQEGFFLSGLKESEIGKTTCTGSCPVAAMSLSNYAMSIYKESHFRLEKLQLQGALV